MTVPCASSTGATDCGAMDTALTRALTAAVQLAPASQRSLCRAAGVDHSQLARVLKGERPPSTIVARRLARTLRQWARQCQAGSDLLSRTLTRRR